MLTIVYGNMGFGKTLFTTAIAKLINSKVVSNYCLKFPFTVFELNDFIDGKYENCMVLLDEAYNYLEARLSGSNLKNKFMSYMLFQSRKKGLEIILTSQLMSTLDLRYRNLADTFVYCKGVSLKGFEYIIFNRQLNRTAQIYLPLEMAKTIFPLYDTNEVIEPEKSQNDISSFMSNEKRNETVERIALEIMKEYNNKKISTYLVKDYMFKHDFASTLNSLVYSRIKSKQRELLVDVKAEKKKKTKEKIA